MTDITAADFDLPERECDEQDFVEIFDPHIFEDMRSIREQMMRFANAPLRSERILMSRETWDDLVEYGRQLRDE